MKLGDKRGQACGGNMGEHGCYLNRGHSGPCLCSPHCAIDHPKAPLVWVKKPDERVARARPFTRDI